MDYVLLGDLAQEWGLDRSSARRYVLKAGFSFLKVRTEESRGQLTLALSVEDAENLREIRRDEGYTGRVVVDNGAGFFYVIQLVPELEPGRVKLGFASDVEARLRAHRTAAPTARLLKAWASKRSWEVAAIDSLTKEGCEPLSGEVFEVDSLDDLVGRGDAFFSLMPSF
jgi:DNA-binding IclR family transcriptional regulator